MRQIYTSTSKCCTCDSSYSRMQEKSSLPPMLQRLLLQSMVSNMLLILEW